MEALMKVIIVCITIGCVYGAPAMTENQENTKSSNHMEEKTFEVEGEPLIETIEQTVDGIIIEVEAQRGNAALTVYTDVTHGLLVHRYNNDGNCYISSLADYNETLSQREDQSSVFKYRLEPISEINRQYFIHTATDAMKRVCSGASDVLWSEVHAMSDEFETREKRSCRVVCGVYCTYSGCYYGCALRCYF